jgi:hypothetical protein
MLSNLCWTVGEEGSTVLPALLPVEADKVDSLRRGLAGEGPRVLDHTE